MNLQNVITPKELLKKDGVYNLYHRKAPDEGWRKKELAVFCHLGTTGMPIFHPLGEPSFQDIFGLENYETHWLVIFERMGDKNDLGH